MANLTQDATLPTGASTGNIDLVTLSAIVSNIATTVLRQVMVLGDPVSGLNKASVVPDEPQGWEAGLVVQLSYSQQLKELNQTLLKIHRELQQININTGGIPATEINMN
jgi:hypothetical protein